MRLLIYHTNYIILLSLLVWWILGRIYRTDTSRLSPALMARAGLLFAVGLSSYFFAEDLYGGDAHSHVGRSWLYGDILSSGEIPVWTNRWYLGYPIGLYYGCLYYLLVGGLSWLTGLTSLLMTKIVLFLLHLSSGLAAMALAHSICRNRVAALFAAIFYAFSYQHTGMILQAGALPLGLIFFLFPLLLLCFEKFYDQPDGRIGSAALQAAVLVVALLLTHVQYGVYAVACYGLLVCLRLILLSVFRQWSRLPALSLHLLLTGILSALLSAWYLVPLVLEKDYLMLGAEDAAASMLGATSWDATAHALGQLATPSREMDWTYLSVYGPGPPGCGPAGAGGDRLAPPAA